MHIHIYEEMRIYRYMSRTCILIKSRRPEASLAAGVSSTFGRPWPGPEPETG